MFLFSTQNDESINIIVDNFGSSRSTVIHVDARPFAKPLRTIDTQTALDSENNKEENTLTIFAKVTRNCFCKKIL